MHKFRFHLLRIIRADFDPHRLDILFVSRYLTNPSEDCPIVSSSLGHSLDCSLDRSIARSIVRSLNRSLRRSVDRSVVQSVDQSTSLPPSPRLHTSFSLPFPLHISPFALPIWICRLEQNIYLTFDSCTTESFRGLICFRVLGVCEDAHGIEGSILNRGGFQLNTGPLESTFRVTTRVRGDEGSTRW